MDIKFLKRVVEDLENPENENPLKYSLNNVHAKGMFSLVVSGDGPGNFTRIFIAGKKLSAYDVQLHSHRYPVKIWIIKGAIRHYVAIPAEGGFGSVEMNTYSYQSFLQGGKGLSYIGKRPYFIKDFIFPIGSTVNMTPAEFHTMSCSKGSIWIVEEKGFKLSKSAVLGVPFIADDLYTEPKPFQLNDKIQVVLKELKALIKSFESVE